MNQDEVLFETMMLLHQELKEAKPTERSERARRYAVTITEFEKVMGYFRLFVANGYDQAPDEPATN